MKLEKAIKLLEAFVQPGPTALDPNDHKAIKLGIEALKVFHRARTGHTIKKLYLLPGETEE